MTDRVTLSTSPSVVFVVTVSEREPEEAKEGAATYIPFFPGVRWTKTHAWNKGASKTRGGSRVKTTRIETTGWYWYGRDGTWE